ncbi:unnamed protein product [Rhizopus stolonifer]
MLEENDGGAFVPKFIMNSASTNSWDFSPTTSGFYASKPDLFDNQKQSNNQNQPIDPTMTTLNQYESQKPYIQSDQPKTTSYSENGSSRERKHLLQKNREAAYRCRQKKKRWLQDLEDNFEVSERKNKELQESVSQLREESFYLRNILLTHGNCDCQVVQDYLRRTSMQLSNCIPLVNVDSDSTSFNPNSLFISQESHI